MQDNLAATTKIELTSILIVRRHRHTSIPAEPWDRVPQAHVDHNMWGLFIHFLGDVFTSMLLLGVGSIYYFLGEDTGKTWWIK